MSDLSGHVAIISGGLGDIGRAIAAELAQRGADIAVGDILTPDKAQPLLAEIHALGRRARYDRVDVSEATAVREWVAATEADLGVPDLIIPNAAIATLADIRAITPEQWDREIRVNLYGVYHLAQAGALRLLEHKKPGRIVFIGSWAGHAPHIHIPAYCVAKAGLRMLCRCMAADLAKEDILVNEVAPGYVDAGLSGRLFRSNPEMRTKAEKTVPVGRLIQPEEVAMQVAHLCDPANRHMTGSILLMDGGLSLVYGGGEH
jgi:glucose 1-dehydrogenase